ncbi:hypothetical protein OSB04_023513 [Centaurea solstitialis]|uniref:Protein kinase domain-containing protein n=1 Tax=Centaurea solstitialis TaxID=347529 RepID=A0AA38SW43_9ASTR|nr:hypothetical protein OSB04_023513 [Centaurea solstitialis]
MEKYHKLGQIGRGSYGVVSKALNTETGELVAIKKMIDRRYHSIKECMNLREVKSLCKVKNHPNIVKLKEVIVENKILFLVFEYMECTLFDRMRYRTKPFSETEIRNICFQIFQGLEYMHNRVGYFHRDLKPENLLVSKDVIKIADLGQAREINGKPPYTDYVTTRWYRAPEVLLHARAHGSSVDMWAMGAIMYELFTLQPLFKGSSATDVMRRICSVIGTPTETTWSLGIYHANNINYRFPDFPGVDLSLLLPSASPEAINLISTLLSWSPCERPTAKEALQHPLFYGCYGIPHPQFDGLTSSLMIKNRELPLVFKMAMQRENLKQIGRRLESCLSGVKGSVAPSEELANSVYGLCCSIQFQLSQYLLRLPSASPEAINLISTLLSWSPCARPTAKEALQHPFFYGCYRIPHSQFDGLTSSLMIKNRELPLVFKMAMQRENLKQISRRLESCLSGVKGSVTPSEELANSVYGLCW